MTGKRAAKAEPDIRTYDVVSVLRHNDDLYAPGDAIELDAAEAKELVAAGVLAEAKPRAAKPA